MIFTVLTATYNRRHTLERLYDSLVAQDFRDFEWLVVDDGSADGTKDLIAELRDRAPFPIRYWKQDNLGKYIALNRGVARAEGELVLNADSDDELLPHALSRLHRLWLEVPEEERAGYTGITGLCVDLDGVRIGDAFPISPYDSDSATLAIKHRIKGDKAGFQRRDVMASHPFPEGLPTKFIPEGRVWIEIARNFKTRFVNEPFVMVHDSGGQRLSRMNRLGRSHGDYEYNLYALSMFARPFFLSAPVKILMLAVLAVRSGLSLGKPVREIFGAASGRLAKMLVLVAVPAGASLHVRDFVARFGELGLLVALSRALPRIPGARRVANLFRRIYVRRTRPTVEIPVLDFQMALEPNECVDGWALFYPHMFDWRELAFLRKATPANGVFVDIGANIGFYSLRMSRHLADGRVIAIEADPYNAAKLRRNIDLSLARNVTVVAEGVADCECTMELRLNTTGNRGGNSFAVSTPGDRIAVQCRPLMDVLRAAGLDSVDSMKLDIEGFEYPVLKAFFEEAATPLWPKAVTIEVEPDLAAQSDGDVLELLKERGYRVVGQVEANFMLLRNRESDDMGGASIPPSGSSNAPSA